MTRRHVIEVLYAERCPHVTVAIERVRHALSRIGRNVDFEVRLILVSTFEEGVSRRFRCSPTVRIDGRDVETYVGRAPTQAAIDAALDFMTDGKPGLASARYLAAAHAAAGTEK